MNIISYLVVFVGAGLGGTVRLGFSQAALLLFGLSFPYGTLFINVLGSFMMGLFTAWFGFRTGMSQEMRVFLTTGLLGGFTTFSTFSLETVLLVERGQWLAAAAYVGFSIGLAIGGVVVGSALVRMLLQAQPA